MGAGRRFAGARARPPGRWLLVALTALLAAGALLPAGASAAPPPVVDDGPALPSADTAPGVRPPFPAPLASPLEPRTRLAPVHVERGARSRWVGLVDLGDAFPFHLAGERAGAGPSDPDDGASPRLLGELAGGAHSRFDLEEHGNEFVEVHYRVGLRLRARYRELDARLELYHVSSHLGDEFLERTGREPVSTSREGIELLAAVRPVRHLRLYGGPGLLLRSTAGLGAGSLRAGVEWRPVGSRWGPFRPYASGELFAWEEVGWEPMAAGEAGLAFGDRYRIAVILGAGPSRAEQFLRQDEWLWGLSFSADF